MAIETPDLSEIGDAVQDIIRDDKRAGGLPAFGHFEGGGIC